MVTNGLPRRVTVTAFLLIETASQISESLVLASNSPIEFTAEEYWLTGWLARLMGWR